MSLNPMDTAEGRQRIWATIYVQALKSLKLRTAWRALQFARMDDPPQEWPAEIRDVSAVGVRRLRKRGASPELIKAAQQARRRRARIRFRWPTVPYSIRWDELDCVTGQSGHGLFEGLRVWWAVRHGTWEDDWPYGLDYDEDEE